MSSTNIYQPYTYLIGWSQHDRWYYGVRFAKGCNPFDLWVKYFTSSKLVAKCRAIYGEPDVIQVRKTFATKTEAINWEAKVLVRLKVVQQSKWLNQSYARQNHDKIDQTKRDVSTFKTQEFRSSQSQTTRHRYVTCGKDTDYRRDDSYRENQSENLKSQYVNGERQQVDVNKRPVSINESEYASLSEAAVSLNLDVSVVHKRINDPAWTRWRYVGPPTEFGFKRRTVKVGANVFPSLSMAAKAYQISSKAAYNRVHKDTWPDWSYG